MPNYKSAHQKWSDRKRRGVSATFTIILIPNLDLTYPLITKILNQLPWLQRNQFQHYKLYFLDLFWTFSFLTDFRPVMKMTLFTTDQSPFYHAFLKCVKEWCIDDYSIIYQNTIYFIKPVLFPARSLERTCRNGASWSNQW